MLKEYLTNIANAIRSKLGEADKVNAQDFADKIAEVYDKGDYRASYRFLTNGFPTPYYIPEGVPFICNSCFKNRWSIRQVYCTSTIRYIENNAFEGASNLTLIEIAGTITAIGVYAFYACTALKTITLNELKLNDVIGVTVFNGCKNLTNFTVKNGSIDKSLTFAQSPLSIASMKNIITHLTNYTGTDSEATQTLTFTSACWTNLEASTSPYEDGLTDSENLTWKDYIQTSLGWLVA